LDFFSIIIQRFFIFANGKSKECLHALFAGHAGVNSNNKFGTMREQQRNT